jgi:plasmid stabilization system protein ParE
VSRRVRFLSSARRDLLRLTDFLAGNPAKASGALEVILAGAASLSDYAERGVPVEPPDGRKLIVPFGRTAYIILYLVEPDAVVITRIFHSLEDRPLA